MIELEKSKLTMSSLDIAEVTGKRHKDVLKSIRSMEPAWLKVSGRNFALTSYTDEQGKERPCYNLTKTETLFVTTKFKDESRAKLVLRWEALETGKEKPMVEQAKEQKPMTAVQMFALQAQINLENENRLNLLEKKVEQMEHEREENRQQLLKLPISSNPVPEMTLRRNIVALVNTYCSATNSEYGDVWHKVYFELYHRYGKSINTYHKIKASESKLDVAERVGLLPYIMDIVSDMVSKAKTA